MAGTTSKKSRAARADKPRVAGTRRAKQGKAKAMAKRIHSSIGSVAAKPSQGSASASRKPLKLRFLSIQGGNGKTLSKRAVQTTSDGSMVTFSPAAFGRKVVARRSGNYIVFEDEQGRPLELPESLGGKAMLRAKLVQNGHGAVMGEKAYYTLGSRRSPHSKYAGAGGSYRYKLTDLKRILARSDLPTHEVAEDRKTRAWNRASINAKW